MTAYEQHLLLRKQLRTATWLSRIIVIAIMAMIIAIDYIRFIGG